MRRRAKPAAPSSGFRSEKSGGWSEGSLAVSFGTSFVRLLVCAVSSREVRLAVLSLATRDIWYPSDEDRSGGDRLDLGWGGLDGRDEAGRGWRGRGVKGRIRVRTG